MINFLCLNKSCSFNKTYEDKDYDKEKKPFKCPNCGGKWFRLSFLKELPKKKKFVSIGYPDNPRWSWAMGANVNRIPEIMNKYPERQYNPKTGQLLVKNRPHKKQLMREHEMEEY